MGRRGAPWSVWSKMVSTDHSAFVQIGSYENIEVDKQIRYLSNLSPLRETDYTDRLGSFVNAAAKNTSHLIPYYWSNDELPSLTYSAWPNTDEAQSHYRIISMRISEVFPINYSHRFPLHRNSSTPGHQVIYHPGRESGSITAGRAGCLTAFPVVSLPMWLLPSQQSKKSEDGQSYDEVRRLHPEPGVLGDLEKLRLSTTVTTPAGRILVPDILVRHWPIQRHSYLYNLQCIAVQMKSLLVLRKYKRESESSSVLDRYEDHR